VLNPLLSTSSYRQARLTPEYPKEDMGKLSDIQHHLVTRNKPQRW